MSDNRAAANAKLTRVDKAAILLLSLGESDAAQVLRVVPGQGTATGLRGADRDARGLDEGTQLGGRVGLTEGQQ